MLSWTPGVGTRHLKHYLWVGTVTQMLSQWPWEKHYYTKARRGGCGLRERTPHHQSVRAHFALGRAWHFTEDTALIENTTGRVSSSHPLNFFKHPQAEQYQNSIKKGIPSVKEACPKTKFQESRGYRSIIVIPTMQKASWGFFFFKNARICPI